MRSRRLYLPLAATLLLPALLRAETLTLPSGTVLHLRNDTFVSTEHNRMGDAVQATVVRPFLLASQELIPVGSTLNGRIRHVRRPGRLWGKGELHIVFEELVLPTGAAYSLLAIPRGINDPAAGLDVTPEGTIQRASSPRKEAMLAGGAAGAGAVIGGVAAGPAGAVVGAGIGSGVMLVRRGRHAYLDAGTEFRVELTAPLPIVVK